MTSSPRQTERETTAVSDGKSLPGRYERPVPVRHPGRWISVVVVMFLVVYVGQAFATNKDMRWDVVGHYLFDPAILRGLVLTVELTIAAMALAIVVGVLVALMRLSPNPVLSRFGATYVWFVRSTPVIVQLLFWYFLGALFPVVGFGIPWGPTFVSIDTNVLIGQFMAAVLGLGLSESAYIAEIVRGGILGVDHGQSEAAQSLGMARMKTMWTVVLPQAMRTIIPPVANAVINMTKMTAVVLIIGLPDLLTQVQLVYARNFLQIPLLTVACIWYLTLVTILTILQNRIEARFSRGDARRLTAGNRGRTRGLRPSGTKAS